jgi:two-component system, LytTR family, sensor kinase
MRVLNRQRRSVLGTDNQRVLVDVLDLLNNSADAIGNALVPGRADDAARHLRRLMDTPAIAICDLVNVLACDGAASVDDDLLMRIVAPALTSARSRVIALDGILVPNHRQGVVIPLVVDGSIVGALLVVGAETDGGLMRTAEQVGTHVSRQVELAELHAAKARLAGAQLTALRAQMSPHFLFNALTAIASVIPDDPQRGNELLLRFAQFIRYRLRNQTAFVTLADELAATDTYLELERARFGERLQVCISVSPEVLSVAVPSLTIQPLVENALRHGLEVRPGPARLSIRVDDGGTDAIITVDDDGVGADASDVEAKLNSHDDADHIGLANVDERLRLAFGPGYGLVVDTAPGSGMRVTMRLPKTQVRVASG